MYELIMILSGSGTYDNNAIKIGLWEDINEDTFN